MVDCLLALGGLATLIGGIIGLGYLVLQPLGSVAKSHVKRARFQLTDLFWLILLLQPSLALLAPLLQMRGEWIVVVAIIVVVWGVTILGWVTMTGVLSDHGINQARRRAAAQLVILPVIAAVIPCAVVGNLIFIADAFAFHGRVVGESWLFVGGNAVFVATILGCRWVARWVAANPGRIVLEKKMR